jgi:hypothetical protein
MVSAEYQRALRKLDAWRRIGVLVMNAGPQRSPQMIAFS